MSKRILGKALVEKKEVLTKNMLMESVLAKLVLLLTLY